MAGGRKFFLGTDNSRVIVEITAQGRVQSIKGVGASSVMKFLGKPLNELRQHLAKTEPNFDCENLDPDNRE